MYRYIIKNRGLYAVYAVLLATSSAMSVFFAFVLSEIMNCAVEENLQKLLRVLIVGIVFLIVTVLSEYLYGIAKNKLIRRARQDLKHDLFDRILHKNVTDFESRNTGDYVYLYKAVDAFADNGDWRFYGICCETYRKEAQRKTGKGKRSQRE